MRTAQSPGGGKIWERVKALRDCREWVRAVKGIEGSGDADSLSSSGERFNRSVRCGGVVGVLRVSSLCITQMKEWSEDDCVSKKTTVDGSAGTELGGTG